MFSFRSRRFWSPKKLARSFSQTLQARTSSSVELNGFCHPKFHDVQKSFEENFEQGLEDSAAVSVYHEGACVVDLWGTLKNSNEEWKEDTIVCMFSVAKQVTGTLLHLLVDRDRLSLDLPVEFYWPEYKDKEKVLVRHVLTHQAGQPGYKEKIPDGWLFDWDKMVDLTAKEKLVFDPESGIHAYHSISMSWLAGEIIHRVADATPGEFFSDEFTDPHDIDYHIGCNYQDQDRIIDGIAVLQETVPMSEFDDKETLALPPQDERSLQWIGDHNIDCSDMALHPEYLWNPEQMVTEATWNSPDFRSAEIPSANGHGNARAAAKFFSMLATNGKIGDHVVFEDYEKLLKNINSVQLRTQDYASGTDYFKNTGFLLKSGAFPFVPETGFGGAGLGGQAAFADPINKLSFGYSSRTWNMNPQGRESWRRSTRLSRAAQHSVGGL